MKKVIVATLAAITLLGTATPTQAVIDNPNINSNVIFYIPHQDDEALTFGVAIMEHLHAGHNVHVVLLTDGSASGVRTKLGMSEDEFSQARSKEFNYSLSIIGIKDTNVSYQNIKDGALTVLQAESVIREYESKYPKAKHKAFSPTDPHPDHSNSGKALQNLQKEGIVTDARYYVGMNDAPIGYSLYAETNRDYYNSLLLAMSSAYRMEIPRLGLYGIGYKSVGSLFVKFESQPISRYHK